MCYLYLAAALMTALAAWSDHRTRQIPNWLTFGGMAAGFVGSTVVGFLDSGADGASWAAGMSLIGGIVCSLPPLIIYRLNPAAIGGGDIKLLVALGMFLGPVEGIEAEFYGFVVAAIYAPARVAYHGSLKASLKNVATVFRNAFRSRTKQLSLDASGVMDVRFAPALLVGTLLCLAMAVF